ncbi:MAG: hypothetical protein HY518_05390 [Candidatus Aenigmarchaeota archaeon]|nr:hypothetical protein [Candidatus Aenigmarchaeota archaeon]
MRQGQSWSFDVTIGVIVFLTTFLSIFAFINHQQGGNLNQVQEESEYVINQLRAENSPLQIVQNKKVNESNLEEISSLSYGELKGKAGVRNDFCIYFEGAGGNIVLINNSRGIGSPSINISGMPCG